MIKILSVLTASLLLVGCAGKDVEQHYKAVQERNSQYMEAYKTVENETIKFNGTFEGDITLIKPKELPQLAEIRPPKSYSDTALEWVQTTLPVVGLALGLHYNYKAMDSANKYNSANIESWTGNFDKISTSNSVSNISDTSVSNTSDTSDISSTSVSSISDTSVSTDTNLIP